MPTNKQTESLFDALYEHVQEPGWFMMKPLNSRYQAMASIKEYFSDNRDDICSLCRKYLSHAGSIKTDFDLHIKEIVQGPVWNQLVTDYIARLGSFADGAEVLLGPEPASVLASGSAAARKRAP